MEVQSADGGRVWDAGNREDIVHGCCIVLMTKRPRQADERRRKR